MNYSIYYLKFHLKEKTEELEELNKSSNESIFKDDISVQERFQSRILGIQNVIKDLTDGISLLKAND